MDDVRRWVRSFFRLVLRTMLVLMGLIFLLSLLVAGLLFLFLWFLRAGWARLRGRPVPPLIWQFIRQPPWPGFGRAHPTRNDERSDVIDVTARTIDSNRPH